jgi:hypothetical protein
VVPAGRVVLLVRLPADQVVLRAAVPVVVPADRVAHPAADQVVVPADRVAHPAADQVVVPADRVGPDRTELAARHGCQGLAPLICFACADADRHRWIASGAAACLTQAH